MGNQTAEQNAKTYNRLGAAYDAIAGLIDVVGVKKMRQRLIAKAKGRVLEVAIGTGENLKLYAKDCDLSGIDISNESIAVAKSKAEKLNRQLKAYQGDAGELPFTNGAFDTVVCTFAGCTFPDPVAAFREMRRVCKPDGQLLFLEHTRPMPKDVGSAMLYGFCSIIPPLTKLVLGCNPTRDPQLNLLMAEITVTERQAAMKGALLAMVGQP